MICINLATQQDFVIQLLEANEDPKFKFEKKEGIKLFFSSEIDNQKAIESAKAVIKSSRLGQALYFQITEA